MFPRFHLTNTAAILAITVLYAAVSTVMYIQFGVKYVNDSHRYLEYAEGLKNGFYYDPHNIWYFSYVDFIYVVQLFSENYFVLILVQYLLGYSSILVFYRAVTLLSSTESGLIACILSMLFIDTIFWSSYILAESFYLSALCFSFYFLVKRFKGQLGGFKVLLLIFACFIAFFAKPTAVALIAALISAIVFVVSKRISSMKIKIGLAVIGFFLLMSVTNRMLRTFDLIGNYQTGEIVYAMSTFPDHPQYAQSMVSVPTDLYIPETNNFPLVQLADFIIHNPVYWSELFIKKVGYSIAHIRPYWSRLHNVYMLTLLIPIYVFVLRAFIKKILPKEIVVLVLVYFLFHVFIFGFTTVDWDGRFFLPLIPVLTFLAAIGANDIYKTFANEKLTNVK